MPERETLQRIGVALNRHAGTQLDPPVRWVTCQSERLQTSMRKGIAITIFEIEISDVATEALLDAKERPILVETVRGTRPVVEGA